MTGLISYLQEKEVLFKNKLLALKYTLIIPTGFIHEFYHLIFMWLFRIKYKIRSFKILQHDKTNKTFYPFQMTFELEEVYPYQLLIIAGAPLIGIIGNIAIYTLICLLFNLGPIIFGVFLIYHCISLPHILLSDNDKKCIKRALKSIKENNPLKIF